MPIQAQPSPFSLTDKELKKIPKRAILGLNGDLRMKILPIFQNIATFGLFWTYFG